MIVRISGEDQYRLDDSDSDRLDELERAAGAAAEGADEGAFHQSLSALLDYVRSHGSVLGDLELEASDVILPPADTTLAEAARDFSGEGLIPD
jgi:hypothetical protein